MWWSWPDGAPTKIGLARPVGERNLLSREYLGSETGEIGQKGSGAGLAPER